MLVVSRFTVPAAQVDEFCRRATRALELLTAAAGCVRGTLGRSTEVSVDGPQQWLLTVEFESVSAYRRAMSPFEVREHVIPLLSEADTSVDSAFEVMVAATDGQTERRTSVIAPNAATAAPGDERR